MRRWTPGLLVLAGATLIAGCAGTSPKASGPQPDEVTTRCEQVVPGCRAERLPNVVLSGEARDGALGPVNESLEGIISFDEALTAAWREDGHPEAKTVQVVLGSADRKALHWDSEGDLF